MSDHSSIASSVSFVTIGIAASIVVTAVAVFMNIDTTTQRDKAPYSKFDQAYRNGYNDGFKDGDHNGRRECCRAVCAADNNLGLFDEGGCFCVARKEAEKWLGEAEESGLVDEGGIVLRGMPRVPSPGEQR